LILVLAVLALALVGTGSALAFDCIRVSSSAMGLKSSTKSGNWALFDLSTGVLAHSNEHGDSVLANLKGIDRLESSPIGAALFGAAAQCGIPVG
jgi:hypothetical protein